MMPAPSKAIAFELDAASLSSLREAIPAWEIAVMNGATAGSLTCGWNPGAADLLVVMARAQAAETLGLCRFLGFCNQFSTDSRKAGRDILGLNRTLALSLSLASAISRSRPTISSRDRLMS